MQAQMCLRESPQVDNRGNGDIGEHLLKLL